MNMSILAGQLYDLGYSAFLESRIKKRIAKLVKQLNQVQRDFQKKNMNHEFLQTLTDMIFSLNNHVERLNISCFDKKQQQAILKEIKDVECMIERCMYKCKMLLIE